MSNIIQESREKIVRLGKLMFDRHLTDLAGGNLSIRVGDEVLMTPKYAGSKYQWDLRPEQIIRMDLKGNKIDGEGDISREAKVHLIILNNFYPHVTSVVHGHARNVLVYCAAEKPMPSVFYETSKFGEIQLTRDAASGTTDLADYVMEVMEAEREKIETKNVAACMMPRHGLVVAAKDVEMGVDATERIDTNAYLLLQAALIGGASSLVGKDVPFNPDYDK